MVPQIQNSGRRLRFGTGGPKLSTLLEIMLFVQVSLAGFIGFGPFLYSDRLGEQTSAAALLYPMRSLGTIGILAVALFFGTRLPRTGRAFILLIYVVYLGATTLWSVDRAITARAAIDMAMVCASLALLCNGLSASRVVNVLLNVLNATLVVSTLLAVAMPSIGVMSTYDSWSADQAGAWRGLFVEKNGLGGTAVIGLVVMIRSWHLWTMPAFIKTCGIAAALACFLLARSANAWVGLLTMGMVAVLFAGKPSRIRVIFTWTMLVAIFAMIETTSVVPMLLEFLGRDITLNGRTPIWATSIDVWQSAWLTGYGYVAGTSQILQPILLGTYGAAARHAHSGYIETLVETGMIGLLIFAVLIVTSFWRTSIQPLSTTLLDRQATTSLYTILLGSIVMAGGDVNATRLVGGWGAITWAAIICTACLPNAFTFAHRGPRPVPRSRLHPSMLGSVPQLDDVEVLVSSPEDHTLQIRGA